MTTTKQRFAMYDAMDAALGLLKERRTRGRFELYLACQDMWRTLAVPVPPYAARKAMRERTLAVGR